MEEGHGTLGSSIPAARTPCLSAVIPPGAPRRDGAPDPPPPVPELDAAVVAAADLERGLAMADAIVFATAQRHGATLVTGDSDFNGLPDVVLIA